MNKSAIYAFIASNVLICFGVGARLNGFDGASDGLFFVGISLTFLAMYFYLRKR